MSTRAELEQDLQIAEAELEQKSKECYEQAQELTRLRGELDTVRAAATAAGVSLVVATPIEQERQELEHMRTGIATDLQALSELRHPPELDVTAPPPESSLDIVRANQRERAELQVRAARGNAIVSRVAAAVRVDQWDDEGSQIVERVNNLGMIQLRVERKLKELRKATHITAETVHWIAALEWLLNTAAEKTKIDPKKPRIINFVVSGHDTPVDAQPEQTLGYLVGIALVRAQCTFKPSSEWLLFAEDGAPLGHDMIASELAGSRVVVTTGAGYGG